MGTPPGANSPPSSAAPPKRCASSRALSVCVSTAYPLAVDLARTRLGKLVPDEYLLRDHVRRAVVYGVLPDGVQGAVAAPVSEGDHGYDVVADRRVLDPEGARLVHQARGYEEVLDLLRAQAVALVLDHGVLAPQEVQVPFLVPRDGVAGVHDPLHIQELRRGERVRAVGFLRRLLVAPVAHRHGGAAVDKFPRLAWGRLVALLVYDHDLGVGDGLADAVALLGGGTVYLLRVQVRRAERLGQAVHQVDLRPRRLQKPSQLVQVGLRDAPAGVGEVAQVGERVLLEGLRAPDQERPQRRYAGDARDLVPAQSFQQVPRQPGTQQVQRRPRPQRRRELAHTGVEVQGQSREDTVLRYVLQVVGDDLGPDHHVALAGRHPFGHPRRARRVQDGPEVHLGN